MNKTFLVGSLFDCSLLEDHKESITHNSLWKQTVFGCRVLNILQDIFHFNVKYVVQKESIDVVTELNRYNNQSVDIFARPMSLRSDIVDLVYPVHHLFDWNFGFTIYRSETLASYNQFYVMPFSNTVWSCLFAMTLYCSILLYFIKRWEVRLVTGVKWESNFGYEVLMVIGAYCQHIPPIDAVLFSRRGAYFVFFVFAYIIHSFYASNLLFHIVNDKEMNIDANTILDSGLESVILDDVMWIIRNNIDTIQNSNNETLKRVIEMKSVSPLEGLKALKRGEVALLSDYVTIQPFIRSVFENHESCDLTNVDIYANIKKYFYISNNFPCKEEFKLAFLRMEETGIMHRMGVTSHYKTECVPRPHFHTTIHQILSPLCVLLGTYVLCVVILVTEMVYHEKNKVWPYAE